MENFEKKTLIVNREIDMKQTQKFCVSLAFLFGVGLALLPLTASAASLSISPSSGTYNIGQTFSASIYVSSPDQTMNAVSANISFPSDLLQIVSLSKNNSIITNWVQEPSFSNTNGTITLEGIVLNPGYQGSSGRILTINFKARTAGTAEVVFTSSSVLANDGLGTNILTNIGKAIYVLENPAETPGAPQAKTSSKIPSETISAAPASKIETVQTAGFLDLKEIAREDLTEPQATFRLRAFDGNKYLNQFEIQIDDGDFKTWLDDGSHLYKTNILPPGQHHLLARALMATGEFLTKSLEFEIKPLNSPSLVFYPSIIYEGQDLVLKGKTDPNYTVYLYLKEESSPPLVYELNSDATGEYSLQIEKGKLKAGLYTLWQQVKDSRGAMSLASEKLPLTVKTHPLVQLGSIVINSLALLVILVALIFLLVFLINYLWSRLYLRRRLFQRPRKKKEELSKAKIKELIEELEAQIKKLENISFKRTLTAEEISTLQALKKHKEEMEEIIMPWRKGYKF